MTTHTTETSFAPAAISQAIAARTRTQWALLSAQWSTLSAGLQSGLHTTVETLRERIRVALEVPSLGEITRLQARIAELESELGFQPAAQPAPAHSDDPGAAAGVSLEAQSEVTVEHAASHDAPRTSRVANCSGTPCSFPCPRWF